MDQERWRMWACIILVWKLKKYGWTNGLLDELKIDWATRL